MTKKLIQDYYAAFNAKKFDHMLEFLTSDIIHDTNQGSRTTGLGAFKSFLADMDRYYDENLTDFSILVSEDGTRASAEFICSGTYKVSCAGLPPARGQKYRLPVGCFFEIRAGKIARITNYYNLPDWVAQVK
jgi:steroid delta-isomerase-like uncharacterized protein